MASLRNIMNVDDEHTNVPPLRENRESTTRPPQSSVPAPSSYAVPPELPAHTPSASSHSRGASPYSTYSHTPDSASSYRQGPLSMSPERRRSIPSEHMGYTYSHAQSYGHTGTYANPAMRPAIPGDPVGDSSVKLTPITGRVSRAKKGVPVHTCDVCRPPKTFTRAEHLRRHQLSHQPAKLVCSIPGCNKVFHRKDLLERHQQRHEHDEKLPPIGRQQSNAPQGRGGQSYGGAQQPPLAQYRHYNSNAVSGNQPRHDGPTQDRWPTGDRSSGSASHAISSRMPDSRDYYVKGSREEANLNNRPAVQQLSSPKAAGAHGVPPSSIKNSDSQPDMYMSDGEQSLRQWHDSPRNASSSTGSTYSTPSDTSHDHNLRHRSSSGDWGRTPGYTAAVTHGNVSQTLPRQGVSRTGYNASVSPPQAPSSEQLLRIPLPLPDHEDDGLLRDQYLVPNPARNVSFPLSVGRSSDTLITIPSAPPSGGMMPLSFSSATGSAMDGFLHPSVASTTLSKGVRDAIPIYIEVYWNKVHPMYPIIHRPTFEAACKAYSDRTEILQCAMAAVATQFLGHEDHRINGNQLHLNSMHKLRTVSYDIEWQLETMQTVLLSEYYSRFRGRDKNAYQASPLFAFLYQKAVTCQRQPTNRDRSESLAQETWRNWVEHETRRRLLAACFLLDVHCMRYFEQAPVSASGLDYSTPQCLAIPLSSNSDQLWESPSAAAWETLYDHEQPCLTVKDAMSHGLKPADIQRASPFDASVLLAAYALQFQRRQSPTRVDLVQDASAIDFAKMDVASLFAHSAVANTYLALHHTPLHVVLSVSGDSWVFNKKVLRQASFVQQQGQLARWRESGSATVAATFAARALVAFLGLGSDTGAGSDTTAPSSPTNSSCSDISDYWGIYVCALICWAFGHAGRDAPPQPKNSRTASTQWLHSAAKLQPTHVQRLAGRRNAQGAVSLAREALEREHFGGRSILIADAVGVLRKLEDGDACKRF